MCRHGDTRLLLSASTAAEGVLLWRLAGGGGPGGAGASASALRRLAGHGGDVTALGWQGADVNASDPSGVTPLMRAAELGREAAVAVLLGCVGVDLWVGDAGGCETAAHRAARRGHAGCLLLLLEHDPLLVAAAVRRAAGRPRPARTRTRPLRPGPALLSESMRPFRAHPGSALVRGPVTVRLGRRDSVRGSRPGSLALVDGAGPNPRARPQNRPRPPPRTKRESPVCGGGSLPAQPGSASAVAAATRRRLSGRNGQGGCPPPAPPAHRFPPLRDPPPAPGPAVAHHLEPRVRETADSD